MAVYRNFYTKFWSDPVVQKMTKDEKLFFIYLFTNEHTTICGIYELSFNTIQNELGFTETTSRKILDSLFLLKRVAYDYETNEIAIRNWLKYNGTESPKFNVALQKAFESIKNKQFINYIYGIDTVSIGYHTEQIYSVTVPVNTSSIKSSSFSSFNTSVYKEYSNGDEALLKALLDYEQMRDKMRKPLTERARELLIIRLDKLEKEGQSKVDILEQSIFNSWQGVFALKPEYKAVKEQSVQDKMQARLERLNKNMGGGIE